MGESACGCGKGTPVSLQMKPPARQPWIVGSIAANGRTVPLVSTQWSRRDLLGALKVRWNIGRDSYTVLPGLYAAGKPSPESPVLVTANYKLSFDVVRRELAGIDAWVLVLDTRGINVWCAAGKGTFGTRELEQRISAVRLAEVVSHRTVILPQLGASGVSAHEVKKATGWSVKYGPVRARDIPAFLAAGQKKDDAMREVHFKLRDRMAVAPVELTQAWPFLVGILVASALFGLPFPNGVGRALAAFLALLGALLVGTFAFPALLPWLPFRAFSLKGAVLGIAWGIGAALAAGASAAATTAMALVSGSLVSFIAMNFTGASTFTCQPGAALEVRRGIVPMAASLVAGLGLAAASRIFAL